MTFKQLLRYVIVYFVLLIVPDEPVASTSIFNQFREEETTNAENS